MQGEPKNLILSVGHGTLARDDLAALLTEAGVGCVVDVRTAPGSRRNPHVSRMRLSEWLPEVGIVYRWEPDLGGWRKPRADSPHVALAHPAFRGYADHMETQPFWEAVDRVLEEAGRHRTIAMCSESLWWKCHRRLLSDALVLARDVTVQHLFHDGRLEPHRVTEGARLAGPDALAYDVGHTPGLPL